MKLMKKIDTKLWTQAEYADRHNISRVRLNQKIKSNDYSDLNIEVVQINGATLIRKV